MSINSVTISGNLTRDAELKSTSSGSQIMHFCVAVNARRKGANGEWEDYPNFIDCTMFGTRAEKLAPILTKGLKVAVDGSLSQYSWEKDGQKRSKVEVLANQIELLSSKDRQRQAQDEYGF